MICSGIRFLLVEDHEVQRRHVAQLLRTLGAAAVHEASDGRQALDLLADREKAVDLVISDVCMPGMDGVEFLRHLAQLAPGLPVIVASALDAGLLQSVAHVADAYKVALLGVLAKPATAAKLTPMLDNFRHVVPAADMAFSFLDIADAWTHDEFQPLFEPRIELESGRVRSVHAVPVWQHPTRGLLAAPDFLPSIRMRGLEDDFTWLMLHKAFSQCRHWERKGLNVQVSVTLALDSLDGTHLASRIEKLAIEEKVRPESVVLHVHEAELGRIRPGMLENFTRLRIMGFGLGVDDFGSGTMDTAPLERIPFTELKIQRDLVTRALHDKSAEAGLAACLDAGQRRRLRTVGDGITSKEEWRMLHAWGCVMAQGPFVSEALDGASVPSWAARWSAAKHW